MLFRSRKVRLAGDFTLHGSRWPPAQRCAGTPAGSNVPEHLHRRPAEHLAALGYADSRPLTENLTPEQRAKNRRVEVVILEHAPQRPEEQENAPAAAADETGGIPPPPSFRDTSAIGAKP